MLKFDDDRTLLSLVGEDTSGTAVHSLLGARCAEGVVPTSYERIDELLDIGTGCEEIAHRTAKSRVQRYTTTGPESKWPI